MVMELKFITSTFKKYLPNTHPALTGSSDGKESACYAGDRVWSLDQEDPLEKGMATHSSILAWRIPWTEGIWGLQSIESQRIRHEQVANTQYPPCAHLTTHCLAWTHP